MHVLEIHILKQARCNHTSRNDMSWNVASLKYIEKALQDQCAADARPVRQRPRVARRPPCHRDSGRPFWEPGGEDKWHDWEGKASTKIGTRKWTGGSLSQTSSPPILKMNRLCFSPYGKSMNKLNCLLFSEAGNYTAPPYSPITSTQAVDGKILEGSIFGVFFVVCHSSFVRYDLALGMGKQSEIKFISGTYLGPIWDIPWTYLRQIWDISGTYIWHT